MTYFKPKFGLICGKLKLHVSVIVLNRPLMTVTFQPLIAGFIYVLFGLCTGLIRTPKCTVITCFLSFLLSIWLVSFLSLQIYAERRRVSGRLSQVTRYFNRRLKQFGKNATPVRQTDSGQFWCVSFRPC